MYYIHSTNQALHFYNYMVYFIRCDIQCMYMHEPTLEGVWVSDVERCGDYGADGYLGHVGERKRG